MFVSVRLASYKIETLNVTRSAKKVLLRLVSFLASANLLASDVVQCDTTGLKVKCICDAPMQVKYGSLKGNIRVDSPLKHLKLTIRDNNIRGLKFGDEIELSVNGYGFDSKTPLYSDFHGKKNIGSVGSDDNEDYKWVLP